VRPKSDKPRLLPKDLTGPETTSVQHAAWTRDPETGERLPEPEQIRQVEVEQMAKENRTRFEVIKAEDRTSQQWQATLEGLGREMNLAMAEGRATGGTILFGNFKRVWSSDQTF
jgi:hypothetical protein